MNCPACNNNLQKMIINGVTLDVCNHGCGGVWFDDQEIKKFDEPHESEGDLLLEIERNTDLKIDHKKRLSCPKCDNIVMARHFYSVAMSVELDECYNCGGIWLDFGELSAIRTMYDSEQDKKLATQKYFDEILGKEIKAMQAKNEEDYIKIRRLVNIFRFMCPSYYIPGKQDWGAY